jgi:hypothetical protein
MAEDSKPKHMFGCPIFETETTLGIAHTCNGLTAAHMSAVRRHLTRPLRGGAPAHIPFVQLCSTCNEHFIDEDIFERDHGKMGELCNNPQNQKKGKAAQEQWEVLRIMLINRPVYNQQSFQSKCSP